MSDYYISGRSYEKEIGPLIQKIGEFVSAFYNINDIMQCLIEQVIHSWSNWIVLLKEQSVSKAFHALRQGLHHAWLPSQWRDLETFLTRSVWVTISAYSWSSIMGFPLVFITLISVTSSIFYLKILMNNFIEKNQILILGVYEFLEKLNTNSNVHYTLQHAHCKRKKKQYELVNFCIFSSKYRQILKAVLFLY